MSVQITVEVKATAIETLELAYDTLLSIGKIERLYVEPKINRKLLFASACNVIKYIYKDEFVTLITVESISNERSKLTINCEPLTGVSPARGEILLFISDLLEKISEKLG